MSLVVPNFIRTALAAPVSTSDTELQLTPGTGVLFNAIGYGNWCYVTVNDSTTVEVMRYVSNGNVIGDTIPVIRGQDNTTPKAFPVGACVAIGWNVGQILGLIDQEIIRLMPMGPVGPTGATGPTSFFTPYDFGAIGDGVADDYDALQSWLNNIAGSVGYGKAGTFMTTQRLTIHGGTTIWGAGKGNFKLTTGQGIPQNYTLLLNANIVLPGDSNRIDKNIAIYGTSFEGDPFSTVLGVPPVEFVVFIGVDGLIIRDCLFQNRRHSLLDLSNNIDMTIDSNEFYNWGSGVSGTGSTGMGIFCLRQNYRSYITNNNLHDSQAGGGIWLPITNSTDISPPPPGNFFICTGNTIINTAEFALVGAPSGSIVNNNNIYNVVRVDGAGHGASMQGDDYTFVGNVIERCDGACAAFSNIQNVIIANNIFNLPAQSSLNSHTGALLIVNQPGSAGAGTSAPRNVTITGNQMSGIDGHGQHAITFMNLGDLSHFMVNIHCADNNFGPALGWSGDVIEFYPSADDIVGPDFIHRDNNGSLDADSFSGEIFIDIGSAGTAVATGIPYRPRTVEIVAVIQSNVLMSQCIGTVNNDFTMFSKSIAVDVTGNNSTTGSGIKLYDGLGNILVDAAVLGFTNDGFFIAINGTTVLPAYVNFTAYP